MTLLKAMQGLLAAGPSGPTTFATINPADTNANLTLSGGNLTFTRNVGADSWASARATQGKISGKWYFEVRNNANGSTDGDIMIGTLRSTDSTGTYAGNAIQSLSSIGYQMNATTGVGKYQGGTGFIANFPAYGFANVGQYSHIAIDLDAGKVWCRNSSGVGWLGGGDPATGTLPTYTIPVGFFVFPAFGCFSDPASGTVNFGASAFNGVVPAGFNPGWYN